MLQPVYTMHRFNWFDVRGTEGVGFVRALRTLLTNNLPQILPDLGRTTTKCFVDLHSKHALVDGNKLLQNRTSFVGLPLICGTGARHTPVFPTIVKLVVLANAVSFFGKDIGESSPGSIRLQKHGYCRLTEQPAKDERFMTSALAYVEETLICAEIVRLVPKFLAPYVATPLFHPDSRLPLL